MKSFSEIKKFVYIVKLSFPHILWIWMGYGFFHALTPFLSLYFSASILNELIRQAYASAFHNVLFMCISSLCSALLAKAFFHYLQVIRQTARQEIDSKLLDKAMCMEYEQLENQTSMDTLRRSRNSCLGSGDIGEAIYNIANCFVSFYQILFALLVFLFVMLQIRRIDGYLLLFFLVMTLYLKTRNNLAEKQGRLLEDLHIQNDRNNALTNYLKNLFYHMDMAKEIRLYHMEDFFTAKMDALQKVANYRSFAHNYGIVSACGDVFAQVMSFSAYVYVASLALRNLISIGEVLYVSGVILHAVQAVSELQVNYAQVRHQLSYLNSFYDFLRLPNMHYDGCLPIEKRDDGEYLFEFRNVSFHYPDSDVDILKHVDVKFHLKEKLAIVGKNGAGKTTLVKLLCRLYEPTEGEILLNGINIKKYDYQEYTNIFSVVFQDFKLFSYEIDENIAGSRHVDEEKLHAVLQKMHMEREVAGFYAQTRSLLYKDNGDGVQVSGGEAQKIAIARALYKDAPFVILDEPTAALDPLAEAEIYEHFNTLVEGKTTLYISHRMSSCQFCERILVMDKGEIVEVGTHEELLANEHIYAQLWNAQAAYYQ